MKFRMRAQLEEDVLPEDKERWNEEIRFVSNVAHSFPLELCQVTHPEKGWILSRVRVSNVNRMELLEPGGSYKELSAPIQSPEMGNAPLMAERFVLDGSPTRRSTPWSFYNPSFRSLFRFEHVLNSTRSFSLGGEYYTQLSSCCGAAWHPEHRFATPRTTHMPFICEVCQSVAPEHRPDREFSTAGELFLAWLRRRYPSPDTLAEAMLVLELEEMVRQVQS